MVEQIIEISDPVYTFCEVLDHIDLSEYLVFEENETGRPRYDAYTLLKVILFAFMEFGFASTRFIEKLGKTDIRFMWLLEDRPAPNLMKHRLVGSIEGIFIKINEYIFEQQGVDLNHVYIDGTKLCANANMYSWVWKKSCLTNRGKVFGKVTKLLCLMNEMVQYHGVKFGTRNEYAIEYLEEVQSRYAKLTMLDPEKLPRGRGHRKSVAQHYYEELSGYIRRLKDYAKRIQTCGDNRNSYSKTDNDATFMRMKRDYMGNDQLLPGFNVQFGVCDEYISVFDVQQFASDTDCFVPMMERFLHLKNAPVKGNKYGRTEEFYQCEDRSGCSYKANCHKAQGNRVIRLNEELTSFHKEVIENLNSVQDALLRMNRSIQARVRWYGQKMNTALFVLQKIVPETLFCYFPCKKTQSPPFRMSFAFLGAFFYSPFKISLNF